MDGSCKKKYIFEGGSKKTFKPVKLKGTKYRRKNGIQTNLMDLGKRFRFFLRTNLERIFNL